MNPPPHDVAAVFFDLDGTLLDTAPDMAGALNQLRRDEGLAALPYLGVRPLVSHGATALVKLGFPDANDQEFGELRSRFLAMMPLIQFPPNGRTHSDE
jgi:phosphoglycolate phosphatase